jgi:endonuclease/exonuclease/phosphatase (EEP) superfamily protein YafD
MNLIVRHHKSQMRILSWNLLCRAGATATDIATLIGTYRPDLVLLQECTAAIDTLTDRVGGHFVRRPMPQRSHGLAAWSPDPFTATELALPVASRIDLPIGITRNLAPRITLVVNLRGMAIANVHLDHGQIANRSQLRHLLACHPRVAVIAGDFNAIGSTILPGFHDAGPRRTTHRAKGIIPLRLDRCLIRGVGAIGAFALPYGPSDHRPIVVDLDPFRARVMAGA